MTVVYLVLITLAILAAWLGFHYRSLVALRSSTDQAWSALGAKLKLRHEIVPRIIEVMKGELRPDSVARIVQVQAKAEDMSGTGAGERVPCESALSEALGLLFHALGENPALLSSDSYITLQDEVVSIEDEITFARDRYNGFVVRYNTKLKVFPESFVAAKARLAQLEEFQIEDAFARYPLKLQPTYPTPRRAFPLLEEKD